MAAAGYSPGVPGFTALRETVEVTALYQTFFMGDVVAAPAPVIASTAVDSGNSPTSLLRPGLIMGQLDSDGSWVDYDPTASDGSEEARGVLILEVNLLDPTTAAAATRMAGIIVTQGKLKEAMAINLDAQARSQLAQRGFLFDGNTWTPSMPWRRMRAKTADYTVLASDNGTCFTTYGSSGAVNFTLPTIAAGLMYTFRNMAAQNMTVTSAEGDNMITDEDLTADSVAFSTSSHKIGGVVRVIAVYVNSSTLRWVVDNMSYATNTITAAT